MFVPMRSQSSGEASVVTIAHQREGPEPIRTRMNDVFTSDPICDCDHTHSISDLTPYVASTPVSLEQRRHLMVGNVVADLQILSARTAKCMINHAFLFVRVWDLKPLCLKAPVRFY